MYVSIIVDLNTEQLNKPFIYKVPPLLDGTIKPGDKVVFPFGKGNKKCEGFVLEILNETQLKSKNFYKRDAYFKREDALISLKEIIGLAEKKIGVNGILLKMAIFLCKEYFTPIQTCLNTVMPVKRAIRKNIRQRDVIDKYEVLDENINSNVVLNDEQEKVVDEILTSHSKNVFDEHLVYGITGSGKTEVYIKVIESVLKEKKKVIVLIPEIALTHQTIIRLKKKFSNNIAIIHSRMSEGERYIQYKKCEDGETDILVGPRSAIFAPFENLGLVVIDEVNDTSYKSEQSPRYNTIDVARYRCKEQNATLITLSATPDIPLYYNAINKIEPVIHFHKLTSRAKSLLPKVILVDMKKEIKDGNNSLFSNILKEKIRDRLDKKEQVMLYMNRRGYDTIFTCKECGYTYKCPHCDVSLVSHYDGTLKCHYCGYQVKEPMCCPECHSKEIEKYGIGTEKLESMCIDLFPDARVIRMDRDTTKEKDGHDKLIETFRRGDADILIGTQMIVKGHDFPNVTLVAVMRADLSLYMQNYKATEYTFSMLTQCVGRSGRARDGESIIQVYDTESYAIQMAKEQDYEKFYEKEIEYRKKLMYPPFSVMLFIYIRSDNEDLLIEAGTSLKMFLETKNDKKLSILGPTPTNPAKKKDIYYRMICIKCNTKDEAKSFRRYAESFVNYEYKDGKIKCAYDIE